MKVRALASISGPQGRKTAGEEFVVNAAEAQALIDRKLVEPVAADTVTAKEAVEKPAKAKAPAEE